MAYKYYPTYRLANKYPQVELWAEQFGDILAELKKIQRGQIAKGGKRTRLSKEERN